MQTTFVVVILSVAVVCCNDLGIQVPKTFSVELERSVYAASVPFPVIVRNVSQEVLYPGTLCGYPYFEVDRTIDGGWVRLHHEGPFPLCPEKPFPIAGGESATSISTIAEPGHYRLVLRFGLQALSSIVDSTYSREFDIQ